MKLKESGDRPSEFWAMLLQRTSNLKIHHLLLLSAGAFVVGLALSSRVKSYIWRPIVLPVATKAVRTYGYVTQYFLKPTALQIDIKHENYQRLAYQREIALSMGKLFQTEESFVSAEIRFQGKPLRARLRLKGDNIDHLRHEKWSFRVVLKGDARVFGMKQFSLQHPESRNYLYEWLYHEFLKSEDVLSLRYRFVNVSVNGKDLGIYALEEHFDKLLVEHRQRREGPILRFTENMMWQENLQWTHPFPDANVSTYGSYLSSDVDVFKTRAVLADSTQRSLFLAASGLLESFRADRLAPSDVFDVQKMADYLAVSDLLNAEHATRWHNVRFYYNPITARLEPIGFDGMPGTLLLETFASRYGHYLGTQTQPRSRIHYDNDSYFISLLNDEKVFEAYLSSLRKVSEPAYLRERLEGLSDELERGNRIIQSEFPFWQFDRGVLDHNRRYIQAILNPPKCLHAYFQGVRDGKIVLKIGTVQPLPLVPTGVILNGTTVIAPQRREVLPGRTESGLPAYRMMTFPLPSHTAWTSSLADSMHIEFSLIGSNEKRRERVFPWLHEMLQADSHPLDLDTKPLSDFNFIHVDETRRTITLRTGEHSLDEPVVIPPGYDVIGEPGLLLRMTKSAKIVSHSPLHLIGSEAHPIVFDSSDGSAQGIFISSGGRESILEHVVFQRLSNPIHGRWALTGAVTFHQSPARISNCRFVDVVCEDALNLFRSKFRITDTEFEDNAGDALDIDFSEGEISGATFVRSGNDGIDLSGSTVNISHVVVNGAGDKGLSAGEGSSVTIRDSEIHQTGIALASKDLSRVTASGLQISHSRVGFAAFMKKPEFGPAEIRASNLNLQDVEIPYLIENRSKMTIDGKAHGGDRSGLKEALYGVKDASD